MMKGSVTSVFGVAERNIDNWGNADSLSTVTTERGDHMCSPNYYSNISIDFIPNPIFRNPSNIEWA